MDKQFLREEICSSGFWGHSWTHAYLLHSHDHAAYEWNQCCKKCGKRNRVLLNYQEVHEKLNEPRLWKRIFNFFKLFYA